MPTFPGFTDGDLYRHANMVVRQIAWHKAMGRQDTDTMRRLQDELDRTLAEMRDRGLSTDRYKRHAR